MALSSSTFLSDSIKFIRDFLDSNITDPISTKRSGRDRFVMTSYPKRGVKYPIITIRSSNIPNIKRSGMQSEGVWTGFVIEVRVWARNEVEKDELTEKVFNALRENQFGAGGSVEFELHDFIMNSAVPIDEEGAEGEQSIKSMVMEYQYRIEII